MANWSSGSCRWVLGAGYRIASSASKIADNFLTVDQRNLVWAMTIDYSIELCID